jgi:Fic family protein
MRTYEKTHPWILFELDAQKIEYTTWLHIGEVVSKIEHIAGVPLRPATAQKLHTVYLAKGALATTSIEGNTLTENEVLRHLDGKLQLPPSREYLAHEIDNIVKACNLIMSSVIVGENRSLTVEDICEYNKIVMESLPCNDDVIPGEPRKHSVGVGPYRAAPAEDCEYLLDRFCEWLNGLKYPKDLETPYSILAAIAAHIYFVWIHPFGDGNGRTARLIEFRYLLQAGFPTPAAHLLSNFYNHTRTEYYRHLDQSSKNGGDMTQFIAYAVRGLVDQLREQIEDIRNLQWDIAWENYVHEVLGKNSESERRRRHLVLDLSKVDDNNGWISVSKIPEISVRLAKEYANKTAKTLSRDINALMQINLVIDSERKIKANKDLILAFLPARAPVDTNP